MRHHVGPIRRGSGPAHKHAPRTLVHSHTNTPKRVRALKCYCRCRQPVCVRSFLASWLSCWDGCVKIYTSFQSSYESLHKVRFRHQNSGFIQHPKNKTAFVWARRQGCRPRINRHRESGHCRGGHCQGSQTWRGAVGTEQREGSAEAAGCPGKAPAARRARQRPPAAQPCRLGQTAKEWE